MPQIKPATLKSLINFRNNEVYHIGFRRSTIPAPSRDGYIVLLQHKNRTDVIKKVDAYTSPDALPHGEYKIIEFDTEQRILELNVPVSSNFTGYDFIIKYTFSLDIVNFELIYREFESLKITNASIGQIAYFEEKILDIFKIELQREAKRYSISQKNNDDFLEKLRSISVNNKRSVNNGFVYELKDIVVNLNPEAQKYYNEAQQKKSNLTENKKRIEETEYKITLNCPSKDFEYGFKILIKSKVKLINETFALSLIGDAIERKISSDISSSINNLSKNYSIIGKDLVKFNHELLIESSRHKFDGNITEFSYEIVGIEADYDESSRHLMEYWKNIIENNYKITLQCKSKEDIDIEVDIHTKILELINPTTIKVGDVSTISSLIKEEIEIEILNTLNDCSLLDYLKGGKKDIENLLSSLKKTERKTSAFVFNIIEIITKVPEKSNEELRYVNIIHSRNYHTEILCENFSNKINPCFKIIFISNINIFDTRAFFDTFPIKSDIDTVTKKIEDTIYIASENRIKDIIKNKENFASQGEVLELEEQLEKISEDLKKKLEHLGGRQLFGFEFKISEIAIYLTDEAKKINNIIKRLKHTPLKKELKCASENLPHGFNITLNIRITDVSEDCAIYAGEEQILETIGAELFANIQEITQQYSTTDYANLDRELRSIPIKNKMQDFSYDIASIKINLSPKAEESALRVVEIDEAKKLIDVDRETSIMNSVIKGERTLEEATSLIEEAKQKQFEIKFQQFNSIVNMLTAMREDGMMSGDVFGLASIMLEKFNGNSKERPLLNLNDNQLSVEDGNSSAKALPEAGNKDPIAALEND